MAERLEQRFGGSVALIEGAKGEFTVWLGDTEVAGKTDGMFPQFDEVLELMGAVVESSQQ